MKFNWKSLFRKRDNKTVTESQDEFYDIDPIDKTGATYRVIIGQRSNGKTYAVCNKHIVTEYLKEGRRSAYIRRWEEDIMPKNLSSLFDPHKELIEELSGGEYNCTYYRAKEFHLAYYDSEQDKITKKDPVAFCVTASINTAEHTKGQDRGIINTIVFDEFMTRNAYLRDEFVQFTNLLSSLIRNREDCVIYMLANTVNRYCPYFEEMGLTEVQKQEQGTIDVYEYHNKSLTVAVEYCSSVQATKKVGSKFFAFENPHLQMITTGQWEFDLYPRPPYKLFPEDTLFKFYVEFGGEMICGEVINPKDRKNRTDLFIFFHPQTKDITIGDLEVLYTSQFTTSRCHVHFLRDCPTEAHKLIASLIAKKSMCFSSNECGEVIRNWLLNEQNLKLL